MRRPWVNMLVSVGVFLAPLLPGAPRPTESATGAPIAETLRNLKRIEWANPSDRNHPDNILVPEAARPLLTTLKHQLRDLVLLTLNAQRQASIDTRRIKSQLFHVLERDGVFVGRESEDRVDLAISQIDVRRSARYQDLLIVRTALSVGCGVDNSFYLLKRIGTKWNVVFALEAHDYEDLRAGQGPVRYAILRGKKSEGPYLVVVYVNPYCWSNWQRIHYKVFRLGKEEPGPTLVLDEDEIIYLGNSPPMYRLKVNPSGFTLAFFGSNTNAGVRVHLRRYTFNWDKVVRVPPFAVHPEEFLEEWIGFPWQTARRWSSSRNRSSIEPWHARLNALEEEVGYEIESIRSCSIKGGKWLASLGFRGEHVPHDLPEHIVFTITKKKGTYFVDAINTTSPPGCPGEPISLPRTSRLP